jgi:WD40 repeat protein
MTLKLHHVHGYNENIKQNAYFGTSNKEIIFTSACVGVKMNTDTMEQTFFGGKEVNTDSKKMDRTTEFHEDDIIAFDTCGIHNRHMNATGETGNLSTVHIWDSNTMTSTAHFELGKKAKGVSALAISPCMKYVAAADKSNDNNVFIYNLQKKKMLLEITSGRASCM